MGKNSRALQLDPNAVREMQTIWDGMIEIDVAAADYDCEATLPTVWVRGIESGDTTTVGNAIKIDHYDILGTAASANVMSKRSGVTIYVREAIPKWPMPVITKVYTSGTTAKKIRLYYQRKRG